MSDREQLTNFHAEEVSTRIDALLSNNPEILYIIVDDSIVKNTHFQHFLDLQKKLDGIVPYNFVSFTNGEESIAFYEFLRKTDRGNRLRTVFLLDGNLSDLDTDYSRGIQVAEKLADLSLKNNWEIPWFIGISSDAYLNEQLRIGYPENPTNFINASDMPIFAKAVSDVHQEIRSEQS